jgi:hypothetical protein
MDADHALLGSLQRRGDTVGGGYVIGDVIGVGGMGVVYTATQPSLDRAVAVKVPRPELVTDPAVRRRFRTEARAGSRVNHRNVVRVLDFGVEGASPYLVMEHVAGRGLGELVDEHGPMPVATAVDLVGQILAGLEDAHRNGIVHADLKCDNILVETQRDGSTLPRIIDFGICRFLDDDGVVDGAANVSGTPEYLAPELIRGAPPTFASDVYAVAVMIYDLITGETPFAGGSSLEIMTRQLDAAPVPLSWRCPTADVSPELDDLVARALAKQPSARFPDAGAFRRALADATAPRLPGLLPRRAPAASAPIFGAETSTAPMLPAVPAPWRPSSPRRRAQVALEERQRTVIDAIARGDADGIVVAYLDLARAHIDAHQLATAIVALEHGIEVLSAAQIGPAWRLLLTLAALYDGTGDRTRARTATQTARDHAVRSGSAVGRDRADQLLARLGRARSATRQSPW